MESGCTFNCSDHRGRNCSRITRWLPTSLLAGMYAAPALLRLTCFFFLPAVAIDDRGATPQRMALRYIPEDITTSPLVEWVLRFGTVQWWCDHTLELLQRIPAEKWRSNSRPNVLDQPSQSEQITLWLVWNRKHHLALPSLATFNYPNLCKFLLALLRRLTPTCLPSAIGTVTSVQLNRNLRSKLHVDKNTSGWSYILCVGNYKRGRTRVELELDEVLPGGDVFPVQIEQKAAFTCNCKCPIGSSVTGTWMPNFLTAVECFSRNLETRLISVRTCFA